MPEDGEQDAEALIARSLERARRWEAEGFWAEARELYAWLMDRFPAHPDRDRWAEACHRCEEMQALEADWAAAEAAAQSGDREAAYAALRRIVARRPDFQRGDRTARRWLEELEQARRARQRRRWAFLLTILLAIPALGFGAGMAIAVSYLREFAGRLPAPIRSPAPGETATPSPERPSLPTPSPSPEAVAEGATFALPQEPLGAAPARIEALARWGAEGVPAGATLSPDGRRILFSIGNKAKWLDTETLRPIHELAIPGGDPILRAAFSPDGRWFALGTEGGRIYLGSPSGPAIVRSVQAPGPFVESLAFSPDSRHLAAGWLGGIGLWEIPALTPRWTFPLQDRKATMRIEREKGSTTEWTFGLNIRVFSVQFSPDGAQLAAGTSAGAVHLLDPRTGEERRRLEPGSEWIVPVAWSPDGSFLAAGASDGRIFLWRGPAAQAVSLAGHEGPVTALAFSPDGRVLLSGGTDRTVRSWSLPDGAGQVLYADPIAWVDSVEGTPEGLLAAFSDGALRLWTWPEMRLRQEARFPIGMHPEALAFDPMGRWLAAGFGDGTLRIWPISSTQPIAAWGAHRLWVTAIAFHPQGEWLASAGADGKIHLWTLPDGRRIATFEGDPWWRSDLTVSPDGGSVIAGGNDFRPYRFSVPAGSRTPVGRGFGFLKVGDEAGRPLNVFRVPGLGSHLALSPDGRWLAVWLPTGEVHLEPLAVFGASPRRIPLEGGIRATMAFSPDGRWLFVGTEFGLWQLPLREDGPPRKLISERPVRSLALSSDGALLAAGSFAGEIHLIRASDGTSLRTLRGHEGAGAVVALAFSPDGRLLASGAEDGTIVLWGAR